VPLELVSSNKATWSSLDGRWHFFILKFLGQLIRFSFVSSNKSRFTDSRFCVGGFMFRGFVCAVINVNHSACLIG